MSPEPTGTTTEDHPGVTVETDGGVGVRATTSGTMQSALNGGAAEKSYSQDQINSLIEARLSRERAKFADYDQVKAKAAEYEKLVESSKSEQQKAVDAARKEGETAAAERWRAYVVGAEVRAQAAHLRFHDPADAVAQLHSQLGKVTVGDDGAVDSDSIKKALEELSKNKPYLVDDGKPSRPVGDAGQGPRNTGGPANMNELIRGLGRS